MSHQSSAGSGRNKVAVFLNPQTLSSSVDHTNLRFDASLSELLKLCAEVREYGFASACVPSWSVPFLRASAEQNEITLATAIGFPAGFASAPLKAAEAAQAARDGATEVDLVLNIGAMRSGKWDLIEEEIGRVLEATPGMVRKLILETGVWTEAEWDAMPDLLNRSGAEFVKTSTGVNGPGAREADVSRLRRVIQADVQIKASGGIRTAQEAATFLALGCTRIGTSSGIAIVRELKNR